MSAKASLAKIRSAWLQRVALGVARGVDVRADFELELEKFFSAMEQVLATGDPNWINSILTGWTASLTQSDLEQEKSNLSLLINKMIAVTIDLAREQLTEDEALDLLTTMVPIFMHTLEQTAKLEMQSRVTFMTNELETTQKKLEELDRTKSNFVSVAAHELKTPLTLVDGYTAMMRDMLGESEKEKLDDLLTGMDKGVKRLREIINDMIDVSVLDNDLLALRFQQTTLSHILEMLDIELQPSVEKRAQSLEIIKFPGIDTWVYADVDRIYQALRNILVNAIKYTPDGGNILVDGRTLPGFIELTVQDEGIGIATEHQSAIFEKFAQFGSVDLHSSGKTKFKGGGPGLGLPITRGLIEAHGGSVWVESEGFDEENLPGSTFHILIPIQPDASEQKEDKLIPQEINIEETHGEKNS